MLEIIIKLITDRQFLYTLASVLAGLCAVFSFKRQMHMFQQNSYFPSRYIGYLKENDKGRIALRCIFFALYAALSLKTSGLALYLFIAALIVYSVVSGVLSEKQQKKSIIPLNFTARVKRTYFVFCLILIAATLLQYFVAKGEYYWFLSFNVVFCIFPYLSVFLLFALLFPIEKAITKHYIKDAKKILSSYGGRLKVIGVTGSYGKTGTKMILTAMLKEKYNVLTTPKNFNTTMGIVRTVREYFKPQTEIFVCEMGAKKKGDIKEICDLVEPECALITSVGPQHLDTFGNIDTVFNTKFELYDSVIAKGGLTFASANSDEIKNRVGNKEVILYGTDNNLDYYADEISCSAAGVTFNLHLKEEVVTITTKLLGNHNVQNIVGAAAVAHSFGVDAKSIKFAVSRLNAPEHRLEIKRYAKGSTLIDDAYNSNPVGCLEACRVLASFAPMNRVLITPGLVELGEEEYKHNFKLGEVASECADCIILVGKERSKPIRDGIESKNFKKDKLFVAESFADAYNIYLGIANENTVVLIENDLPDNYLK